MNRKTVRHLALWAAIGVGLAFSQDDAIRIGPGVTPPKPVNRPEPKYTEEARRAGVQGTVLIEVIIDESGRVAHQVVLSPLGFGLDENALATTASWTFRPGMKDGKPVKVLATIEVNFRFPGANFDAGAEKKRTDFNTALHGLQGSDAKRKEKAVKTMEDLARQKFPEGMYAWGVILMSGELVPKDTDKGLEFIALAAQKHYGPALFEVGRMHLDGIGQTRDAEKGMQMIREAATVGSKKAQYFLGAAYADGERGIDRDPDRARKYFRLCAAAGDGTCQFRLAKLLLEEPHRPERDYIQAIAWLQLAANHDVKEAGEILNGELPKLSREQVKWFYKLQEELVRK